jgi:hypothetical protein
MTSLDLEFWQRQIASAAAKGTGSDKFWRRAKRAELAGGKLIGSFSSRKEASRAISEKAA